MRPMKLALFAFTIMPASALATGLPNEVSAPNETLIATAHAVGAQVYECKADAAGQLRWQFREPIASLFIDGKTVGRHYAGPRWELVDGSMVEAKVAKRGPAASVQDIPHLKLDVVARRGAGQLASVTTILRINTRGGVAQGACETHGVFLSVPYSADYALYGKPD